MCGSGMMRRRLSIRVRGRRTMDDDAHAIERWASRAGRQTLTTLLARGAVGRAALLETLALLPWERSWLRRVLRRNRRGLVRGREAQIIRGLAYELDALKGRQTRRRTIVSRQRRKFRGNRTHLALLTRSVGSPPNDNEWNDWRRAHPRTRPDLRGVDLNSLELNDLQLDRALLSGANLSGSNLFDADLSGADLRRIAAFGTDLRGANLSNARLEGAWLHDADLTNAEL